MRRRTFLGTIGGGSALGLAGCLTRDGDGDGDGSSNESDGTLTVVTYTSMIDEEDAAGPWLKEAFEDEHPDAELKWEQIPEYGINHYIDRADGGGGIDADVYLGLNIDDLALVDDKLSEAGLFQELDTDRLDRADRIREGLELGDPHGRALPYDTGYISLVYDESQVDEPETFDDLTDPAYEDALLAQSAIHSDTGQAFLLWTIDAFGEDGYLDYWRDLDDNGVRILQDWDESYNGAYTKGERSMVVSYSTDQVYASTASDDLTRHQVAFPNGQGYANPEGMGIFEAAGDVDLAYDFFDFVLSNEAQAEIAQRNVQFPAVDEQYVDLDEEFDRYAHEPPEAVTIGYERLRNNLDGWLEDWGREFASQ